MEYYVRLVRGKGIISNLIEFKESDWPSHVELVQVDDYGKPVSVLGSRYPGGVQVRGYNDYDVVHDVWLYDTRGRDICKDAWSAMSSLCGHTYDLIDIFGIALNQDWHVDGRYICSEAVAWAFEQIKFPLFNTQHPTKKIVPAHFLLTPYLYVNSIHKIKDTKLQIHGPYTPILLK